MHAPGSPGDGPGAGAQGLMESPLDARETRWRRRLDLAAALPPGCSLLSFTLRMPAPLRLGGGYDRAAGEWFDELRGFLARKGLPVLSYEFRVSADGPEGFCAVRGEGNDVKRRAVAFEETDPCGALVDVDVTCPDGSVPGRRELELPPRRCVVCGGEAAPCVTGRAHSAEELRTAVEHIAERGEGLERRRASFGTGRRIPDDRGGRGFLSGLNTGDADAQAPDELERRCAFIGSCARTAVLYEAAAAPKPGLVTPFSNGAHADMDYFTFLASSASLAPFWERFARLGVSFAARLHTEGARGNSRSPLADPSALLPLLRGEGVRAERAMFAATGGVNTHKGLVFSLGLLCAASGMLLAEAARFTPEACARRGAEIVRGIVERDFADAGNKAPSELTAGERLYLSEGVTGIRGEAERGFPSVVGAALPRLRELRADGMRLNDALVETLLLLMTEVEDTNILARGGREGERVVREAARNALALGGVRTEEGDRAVGEMDALLASRRLSPGGAADLLAITIFLFLTETFRTAVELHPECP